MPPPIADSGKGWHSMARQLPAVIENQRALSQAVDSRSTVGRMIAAAAPDIIRAAERIATQRLQRRERTPPAAVLPEHTEAMHLSEVEIDVSVPFVRRVTMRNMTAWQNGPATPAQAPEPRAGGIGLARKIGLIGASSALALGIGVLARRVGPFSGQDDNIIDVSGSAKS